MRHFFIGRYYKHQKSDNILSFIIGHTKKQKFIQILTQDEVLQYNYLSGLTLYRNGIKLNYPKIKGYVRYGKFLPLSTHIMGPFHYLPMQCNHEVISMRHSLKGGFFLRDKYIDLTGGLGYIEGDYGRSFPKEYVWLHCNDFSDDLSIMVSIADIPFCGTRFTGCICAITYHGKEYRLATYRGVRIRMVNEKRILLTQGRYCLDINVTNANTVPLRSPNKGNMINTIHESNNAKARFRFMKNNTIVFQCTSNHCSFEYNLKRIVKG